MTLAWRLLRGYVGGASSQSILSLTTAPYGGWVPTTFPRAMQSGGYTFIGGVAGDTGNVDIWRFANATQTTTGPTVLHAALGGLYGPPDDHAAPAIHVRTSDGRLLVIYCVQGDTYLRKVISTNPLDITDFSSEAHLVLAGSNYLYPTIAQLSGEASGRVYVHWKDFPGTTYIRQAFSDNNGLTFTYNTQLYTSTNVFYAFNTDDATRMDFAVSDIAPGGANGLYHFYEIAGQLYKTDGTAISTPVPIGPSNATQIYAPGTNALGAFPYSLVYTSDDRPVVACAEYSTTSCQYFELRWSGSAWNRHNIATTPPSFFGNAPPGITHSDQDANRVWLGKKVGSDFHMFEYVSGDDGATWSGTDIATYTGSDIPQTPTFVKNAASPLSVIWTHGIFTSDYSYSLGMDGTT